MSDQIAAKAAAEILGVDRSTVWRLVKTGELPATKVDGSSYNLFDRAVVEEVRDRRARAKERARTLRYKGVRALEQLDRHAS